MKKLFTILAISVLGLSSCIHHQNKEAEYVIKNDAYTKTGGHGYKPNYEKAEEASPFTSTPILGADTVTHSPIPHAPVNQAPSHAPGHH